ncbi:MAG: hypothetical protein ABJA77_10030 [Variovorax sp.]
MPAKQHIEAITEMRSDLEHSKSSGIVAAKNSADSRRVALVRAHLHDIQARFFKGDFSGSVHIHGEAMPGLAQLTAADPGQVSGARAVQAPALTSDGR